MFEVYIHVPFCLRRCGYCDFNTYTATDLGAGASRGNYANMVIREMKLTKQWQLDHGIAEPPVSTVFFGGGTPTILAARDLVAVLDAVRKIWSIAPDAEITTEANPDTVNEYYINELAAGGFTRVSFGMQSAVPHVLKTLDRTHTPANVAAGVNAANKSGLRSSVDLIYGAPGESLDDWRTSVTTAIDLGVNHISAYALTVEPTTKMGRQIAAGTLPKPNDDDEAAKYEIADDLFAAAGLEWYEVSNWARPGYESQHNLGYWRNVDWAGLGPGAHSHYNAVTEADHPQSASLTAPAGGGCPADAGLGVVSVSHGLRSWDIAHPRLWGTAINENRVPWADSETITPEENLEELIMLGLRLHEGLDLDRINRAINDAGMSSTPQTLRNVSLDQLAPMVSEGLITVSDNHRVVPTRRGRLLNDSVIEQFFDFVGV
ncbi:radical SAM family heme chaperone HemW [Bifidobacterium longum]|uniref:radical SAM family heme chaperone HemW n=1 Tax=Bifidobacterium longum TaxID=216816 RepID=UPI0029717DE1|nr:radical SAM family heme chaperone HemW [Bifidobacterium longum]MDB6580147.1 radical SAM family heme chaperone HemW [Bifidobacterium longum]MDB6581953.1 radical SAM family heme chaperone HemW [Bifidobacterium longum]